MAKHAAHDLWADQRQDDCHWWPTKDAMGATIWHVECFEGVTPNETQQRIIRLIAGNLEGEYCPWCGACWVDNGEPMETV